MDDPPRTWISHLILWKFTMVGENPHTQRIQRQSGNSLMNVHSPKCLLDRRWHRRDGIVHFLEKKDKFIYSDILTRIMIKHHHIWHPSPSTSRRGHYLCICSRSAQCWRCRESGFDPLAAKGSRGIYIVPDIYFDLSLRNWLEWSMLVRSNWNSPLFFLKKKLCEWFRLIQV